MNPTLVDYFVNNHEHLKELLQPHCDRYLALMDEEDPILRNDIDREFSYVVKSVLINESSKALAVSTEECMIVVESIDIKEFLK